MNIQVQLLILAMASCLLLRSQDFHLSQYDATPHYFNPALTGIYFNIKADYRIYSDYRSQWKSLGIKPFSTYYLAYDMPYKEFGFGGYLIHNRNGKGGFNTINIMPSAAYDITKTMDSPHKLSVGAQLGIFYRNFNPNHFTYETQFDPDAPNGFNQNISSGEVFLKTSLLKLDAAMGVFYKYEKAEWKTYPWGGFAVYHVTRPNQSVSGSVKDKMPFRWVTQIGTDYKVNEEIRLTPMLLYMNQGKAYELNFGAILFYHMRDTKYDLLGGLNYRWKDAVIVQFGGKYDQHIFTFSYDINISNLNAYTNGRGAFEFSIILTGIKGKALFNPKFSRGKSVFKSL